MTPQREITAPTPTEQHTHRLKGYPFTKQNCQRAAKSCRTQAGVWRCECGLTMCTDCLIDQVSLGTLTITATELANMGNSP